MATTTHYEPSMPVRSARARYFAANGFAEDGGYSQAWVTLVKLGPVRLGFPNTAGRIKAVRYHDLHHLVTGYDTDFIGEAEIAAWELGSGCTRFPTAWVLNSLALLLGFPRGAKRVAQAFARGCRTQNLYPEPFADSLLEEQLGELRERLGLAEVVALEPTAAERRRYRLAVALGLGLHLLVLSVGVGVVAALGFGVVGLLD
jgi:hypothetical protein